MLNIGPVLNRMDGNFAFSSTVHEQAQSNRAFNIFIFVVLGVL
jgi:hypothetical protein